MSRTKRICAICSKEHHPRKKYDHGFVSRKKDQKNASKKNNKV